MPKTLTSNGEFPMNCSSDNEQPALSAFQKVRRILRQLGLLAGWLYILSRYMRLPSVTIKLRSSHAKHALNCRLGTSDIGVFRTIFGTREYSCLDDVKDASLILDCGANVGYSSAYFLSRFPNAQVIAVEPDPENFKILEENMAPYAGRVTCICSAIWSKKTSLRFPRWKNATAHSVQVLEAREGEESSLESLTIDDLIAGYSGRISILKIDIECAEKYVFAENYQSWLSRTDNLVIELHDEECRKVFETAIAEEKFNLSESGELTVCKRQG